MDKKVWVIVAWAIVCQWTHSLPVPDEDDSFIGNRTKVSTDKKVKAIGPVSRLPTSPVDLLRPDKISFYTLDSNGQVVLKRMTEKEIQSLIAAGGGQLPVAISEPQKITESTGTKISDVVENVQKVLEGELNKPPQTMTAVPTIPGHANSEWSSILPAILAGDSDPIPVESHPIQLFEETDVEEEKPMIQVPVITIEEPIHVFEKTETEKPIFEILNTIPAEKVKEKTEEVSEIGDKTQEVSEIRDKIEEFAETKEKIQKIPEIINLESKEPADSLTVISETHSTSVKVSGQEEVKTHEEEIKIVESSSVPAVEMTEIKLETTEAYKVYLVDVPPTSATLASEEVPQKVETEALPTELTDSITSMISQVSDAIPSMVTYEKSKVSDGTVIDADYSGTSPLTTEGSELTTEVIEILEQTTEVKSESTESETSKLESTEDKLEPIEVKSKPAESETSKSEPTEVKSKPAESETSKLEPTEDKSEPIEVKLKPAESETSKLESTEVKSEPAESETSKLEPTEDKLEPIEVKLKLAVSGTSKLEPTEVKSEPAELETSKLEPTEDKLEPIEVKLKPAVSETSNLEPTEDKSKPAESETSKLEPTEDKLKPTEVKSKPADSETSKLESTEEKLELTEKSETTPTSEASTLISTDLNIPESKEELSITETDLTITEKPILRLNITDPKEDIKITPLNISGVTESAMVRIKLTEPINPINKIHETLESSPVQSSTPEIHPLILPESTKIPANGIASGLIAGFTEQQTEIPLELIQFDQLPMLGVLKFTSESPITSTESTEESKEIRKDQKKETSLEKTPSPSKEDKDKDKDKWTLISQTQKPTEIPKRPLPPRSPDPPTQNIPLDHSKTTPGLDSSVLNLEPDVLYFSNLCNDLAFNFWASVNQGLSRSRSLAVSPFGMTSLLAMIFLGARGPTSNQMNDLLKLDDITTFNPHLIFQNVTDSVASRRNQGIANAVFVRELFADKLKVNKLMTFYKEQAQKFYDGIVAEVNFSFVSNTVKRRTNLLIRKQTGGRIREFVKDNNLVPLRSPLAAVSANVFQTDCSSGNATSEGRDGELYFAVAPTVKLRKLVPVPATLWKSGVLAGYETSLDATAIALGGLDKMVSVIFVIPGSQGGIATGDNLERLEARIVKGALHDGAWGKLLKVVIPRPGLELQVPKFSHKSIINATLALKGMGLEDIFDKHANLRGINDVGKDLHLADVFQMNLFSTCGDENFMAGKHHEEVYPASPQRNARSDEENQEHQEHQGDDSLYLSEAERIARFTRQVDNEKPRLKLDRPFLYFVRHNPTGLILYMGRFNPRLIS